MNIVKQFDSQSSTDALLSWAASCEYR